MFLSNKKYIGLSIDILEDESRLINYVCLKKTKKNISVVEKKQNLTSLDELSGVFSSDSFVHLSINGKGIINKKIADNHSISDTSQDKLISLVLPNANSAEFYAQTNSQEKYTFISVCRKNLFDSILADLGAINCMPINVVMGPFEIQEIASFINTTSINTNVYKVSIDENEISDVQKITQPAEINYTIEGEEISASAVLAFSSAIAATLAEEDDSSPFEEIKSNRVNINFQHSFKTKLAVSLFVIFGILLLNFVVYDLLFSKVEHSKKIRTVAALSQTENAKAQENYKEKKRFIDQKNWNSKHSISELVEQLASTAPNGVRLKEISYQKFNKKKSNNNNQLKYEYKEIQVEGVVNNSNQLNNWMKALVASDLFSDVNLQNYQLNSVGSGNSFNLEIVLK